MRIISIICLALVVILSGLSYASCYWLGYSETPTALEATDPLLQLLAEFILFLILIFMIFRSLMLKEHRLWMLSVIAVYVALNVLLWFTLPSHGPFIVYGLRDRMMRDYGLDGMRNFARDIQEELGPIPEINHGDIKGLAEPQKTAYENLRKKYPFMCWMDDGRFSHGPTIFSDPNHDVTLEWGGPLMGHRGFSITLNGNTNDIHSSDFGTVVQVSYDIYFYLSD